jgi:mRNA-processing protein COX24
LALSAPSRLLRCFLCSVGFSLRSASEDGNRPRRSRCSSSRRSASAVPKDAQSLATVSAAPFVGRSNPDGDVSKRPSGQSPSLWPGAPPGHWRSFRCLCRPVPCTVCAGQRPTAPPRSGSPHPQRPAHARGSGRPPLPLACLRPKEPPSPTASLPPGMGSLIKKRRKRMRKKKHKKMLKATRWQRRAGK